MNISRVGAQIGRVPSEAVEEPDPQFVGDRRYENIGTRRRRRSKDEAEIEAELVPSHPQQQRLKGKRPPRHCWLACCSDDCFWNCPSAGGPYDRGRAENMRACLQPRMPAPGDFAPVDFDDFDICPGCRGRLSALSVSL